MKYHLCIYYTTDVTRKVSEMIRQVFDDWRDREKELQIKQVYEVDLPEPLNQAQIDELKAHLGSDIRHIELEPVSRINKGQRRH